MDVEAGDEVCTCGSLACGGDSNDGGDGAGGPLEADDSVAPDSGTSKGFGRSRPSAVTRGVSCSSTDGQSLIIAFARDGDDGEEQGGAGVGYTPRVAATDVSECGTAGVSLLRLF